MGDALISQPPWQGDLQLTYGFRRGTTQLVHHRTQAPLKIQRPFYPEGPTVCHSVVLHTAGGVVGGDRLSYQIQLQPQAQALITTTSASKIYRSNGLEAHQTVRVEVAEGACLEWLPQETIVFDGAVYRQDLRVELATNATWLGWEITRMGRTASGEQFLRGNWRSRTEVWRHGQPLWIDPQWLPGGTALITSPHGLAGYPVIGSFALVGRSVTSEMVEQVRSQWDQQTRQGQAGVTRLMEGLLCRYRGPSSLEARRWFTEVWQLLRLSYLERPVCLPRVWPT